MSYLYAADCCDICGNGIMVFAYCEEKGFIILWCLECDVFWRNPEPLDEQNAIIATVTSGDFIPELECTFNGFRPATRAEIALRGWEKFIQGEY